MRQSGGICVDCGQHGRPLHTVAVDVQDFDSEAQGVSFDIEGLLALPVQPGELWYALCVPCAATYTPARWALVPRKVRQAERR